MRRTDTVMRAGLVLLVIYLAALGGTYTGVTTPVFQTLSLALLGLLTLCWLAVRWRRGWVWHQTPLDAVFILWAAAFGLSFVVNAEVWRRMVIGLWYAGLYVAVWYMLHDLIANRALKRDMIVDALLFTGLVMLFFGYWQVSNWLLTTDLNGTFTLPRPVSLLGNPNFLGAFLVVLIPFALGRLAALKSRAGQLILGGYVVLAGGLLFLTFSRGAWLGLGAGLVVWFALLLGQHDLLSLAKLWRWWQQQTRVIRAATFGGLALAGTIAAGAAIILVRSLAIGGRDVGFRTYLYEAALALFLEKLLTGHGLFTFGRYLPRFASMPDVTPHTHAHSIPLHIAAELGLMGLIAFGATTVMIFWLVRQNLRESALRDRAVVMSAAAGVVGFGVHHLLDTPAMMPAVALVGLVALALALASAHPAPLQARWRQMGHPLAMAGLPLLLLVSGLWSSRIYQDYWDTLRAAHETLDYRAAAGELQAVIDADPALSLYRAQQAFLLGMAHSEGDRHAGVEAVSAYRTLIGFEPYYAPYRANLAMLLWNTGQQAAGLEMLQTAAAFAPESWQLHYIVGLYTEAARGSDALARAAYAQALLANPDADLHLAWGQTALQAEIRSAPEARSPRAQVAVMIAEGDSAGALALWDARLSSQALVSHLVLRALIALEQGDREDATRWLAQAQKGLAVPDAGAWLGLGAAWLARFDGDAAQADAEALAAQDSLQRAPLDADFVDGRNIANGQFLRQAIARQFLPHVYYPTAEPDLVYLLNRIR